MKIIAIVTGASSGLGREFVRRLPKEEALDEIWVIARRRERLEALRREVSVPLRPLPLDLTDPQAFRTLDALLSEEQPCIRVLINAAGFGKIGGPGDVATSDCGRMIDLNCKAAVEVTNLALPYLKPGSRILQICSTAAFQPFPYLNVYAATKAFLYRYTRALRVELRARGISVTAVCPYWIKDTEFIQTAQQTKNSRAIRHFPLATMEKRVVQQALADSRHHFAVSTPGVVCTLHRAAAKLLPASLLMAGWEGLRRL